MMDILAAIVVLTVIVMALAAHAHVTLKAELASLKADILAEFAKIKAATETK